MKVRNKTQQVLVVVGISCASILVLLAIFEIALRIANFRFSLPTLEALNERRLLEPAGKDLVRISPDLADAKPFGYPFVVREPEGVISLKKDPDALRVVFVGDSTGHAFNWSRGDFVTCLQNRTNRKIEFINLSFSGCGSDRTLPSAREALSLKPDFMIIATGHSDFVSHCNPLTYADFQNHKGKEIARAAYGNLRILQALAKASTLTTKTLTTSLERKHLGQNQQRVYSEAEKLEFYALFADRLRSIARESKAAGVTTIFATMAYNYMIPPLWESSGKGPTFNSIEAPRLSLEQLKTQVKQPGSDVLFRYYLGRRYQDRGDLDKARQLIDEALALSARPFTATTTTNQIIREVAKAEGIIFTDIKNAVDKASYQNMANGKLMGDHCHLNLSGNMIMLDELCGIISRSAPPRE